MELELTERRKWLVEEILKELDFAPYRRIPLIIFTEDKEPVRIQLEQPTETRKFKAP